MAAFEITINGAHYAESEDITAVTVVTEETRGATPDRISIHAQTSGGDVQWLDAHLSAGDEIRIRVVAVSDAIRHAPEGCSFCARNFGDLRSCIQGVTAIICDDCTKRFAVALIAQSPLPLGASIHDDPLKECGFCGRHSPEIAGVVVRNGAAICGACVHACEELLE